MNSLGTATEVKVRSARAGDEQAIASVRVAAYEAVWGLTGWDQYREELNEVCLGTSGEVFLVAEVEGKVIGTVRLLSPAAPGSSGLGVSALEVRMLAVHPAFQRRGVARTLLDAASDVATEAGLTELALQTDEDLIAAHHLYEALGFSRDASIDTVVEEGWAALGFRLGLSGQSDQCREEGSP